VQAPPSIVAPALTSMLAFAMKASAPNEALPSLATAFVSSQLSVRVCAAGAPPICCLHSRQTG